MEIRRAVANDAFAIASVLHRSFAGYEASYTPEAFAVTISSPEEIRGRLSEGPIWVAVLDDAVVGTVSVVPQGQALYIRSMAVDPAAQGKRIGHGLLECVEEFAARNGFRGLFLSTTPFLTQAIRLYERHGFQRSDEGPDNLFGTPLFRMVKSLDEPNLPK
ncbi:MAG TPA: GNAT family N-acetyltransferase [Blastocatellia bacterium]|nr:GNAT family N-acetyltransferase [Blastocatellia bacterium]